MSVWTSKEDDEKKKLGNKEQYDHEVVTLCDAEPVLHKAARWQLKYVVEGFVMFLALMSDNDAVDLWQQLIDNGFSSEAVEQRHLLLFIHRSFSEVITDVFLKVQSQLGPFVRKCHELVTKVALPPRQRSGAHVATGVRNKTTRTRGFGMRSHRRRSWNTIVMEHLSDDEEEEEDEEEEAEEAEEAEEGGTEKDIERDEGEVKEVKEVKEENEEEEEDGIIVRGPVNAWMDSKDSDTDTDHHKHVVFLADNDEMGGNMTFSAVATPAHFDADVMTNEMMDGLRKTLAVRWRAREMS